MPNSASPERSFSLNKAIGFTFIGVFVLGFINLIGTNSLATQGVVLDQIARETDKITKENQILEQQIGKISNLSYIESTASQLGFVRVKNSLIITGIEAVAAIH